MGKRTGQIRQENVSRGQRVMIEAAERDLGRPLTPAEMRDIATQVKDVLTQDLARRQLLPVALPGEHERPELAGRTDRQVDLRVLELWQQRRYREFLDMLPDYVTKCNGEGGMADTIMLFAALGWDAYRGAAEQLCEYFPSSGSGQVNVEFHVDG